MGKRWITLKSWHAKRKDKRKGEIIRDDARVRIRWPANQWKPGTIKLVAKCQFTVELDGGGTMTINQLDQFEIEESYETGRQAWLGN